MPVPMDEPMGCPMVGLPSQAALGCRAAQVLMQYCILANHYWFLVEAVYLYKLLIGAVFSEKNYYRLYLYLGWGRGHPGMWWGWGQDLGSVWVVALGGCGEGALLTLGVLTVPPVLGLVSELRQVLDFTGFAV